MTNTQDRLARAEERLTSLDQTVKTLLYSQMEQVDRAGHFYVKAHDAGHVSFATGDIKRLNALEARVHKMENRLDQACDELGSHIAGESQTREAYARQTMLEEEHAEQTLAKAVSAGRRRSTAEGLLERADRVLSDPSQVGAVAAYVSAGQFAKAAEVLERAEIQARNQGEDDALAHVNGRVDKLAQGATTSQLTEQLAAVQHALNSVLSRLSKLERRQGAPAPAPRSSQTVAKASSARRQPSRALDPRDTAQGLLTRAEGVIDSPAQVGHVSSLVQAGRLDEARRIIEQAELRHESDRMKKERRAL